MKIKYTEEQKAERFPIYFLLGMCLVALLICAATYLRDGYFH